VNAFIGDFFFLLLKVLCLIKILERELKQQSKKSE